MKPILAFLLLALLLAGCQPLPQPLAEDRPPRGDPIITLRDAGGVVVLPVANAPEGFEEVIAAALRELDIVALTAGGNRASFRLESEIRETSGSTVALAWRLLDHEGKAAGGEAQPHRLQANWRQDGRVIAELARAAAPRIAALVQNEAPAAAPDGGRTRLVVRDVVGAPGDGDRALTRAIRNALRQSEIALADAAGEKDLVLKGRVTVAPPAAGFQQVAVVWTVEDARGASLGEVRQENRVPARSLDGAWGDVAFAVANAASEGIQQLIERLRVARRPS